MEELQDLHILTKRNQLGVDADTKAIMQGPCPWDFVRWCGGEGGCGGRRARQKKLLHVRGWRGGGSPLASCIEPRADNVHAHAEAYENFPSRPNLKQMWCVVALWVRTALSPPPPSAVARFRHSRALPAAVLRAAPLPVVLGAVLPCAQRVLPGVARLVAPHSPLPLHTNTATLPWPLHRPARAYRV